MLKLPSRTSFCKAHSTQQFLYKQRKQIIEICHGLVQESSGYLCFLKPSAMDWLLKIFERKSHFPMQVRFNVNVPSCARSAAECGWLIHLPAQQLQCVIYCCVGCLDSSAPQPFILPDADHPLRRAKISHLSVRAWCLAESDLSLVGFVTHQYWKIKVIHPLQTETANIKPVPLKEPLWPLV